MTAASGGSAEAEVMLDAEQPETQSTGTCGARREVRFLAARLRGRLRRRKTAREERCGVGDEEVGGRRTVGNDVLGRPRGRAPAELQAKRVDLGPRPRPASSACLTLSPTPDVPSSAMDAGGGAGEQLSLAAIRDQLIREEDSIVFALIERAKRPRNAPAYSADGAGGTLAEFFVREAEVLLAKAGHYQKPEDVPFFPQDLPPPLFPTKGYPKVLHPSASLVCVNNAIWKMYFNELLPLFTAEGDDGNYAETVALDFACLQALSRRIHCGKYVAEVKFKDSPQDYSPPIHAKDSNALMNLLTFKAVEEKVKKRVEKKARIFGQNVTLEEDSVNKQNGNACECKVDPKVLSKLYDLWVMPLTKDVEVEYLLRRLD